MTSKYTDNITAPGTKTITVIVANDPDAYVTVTATANPSKEQVDGSSDQTVVVSIASNLNNISDASNISSRDVWVKFSDDDSSVQHINLPGGSLSASASFTFVVPKSKLAGNDYVQTFKATVQYNYINSIANDQYVNASAYTTSEFYKLAPPAVPLGDPVMEISAPSVVYAGDPVAISGAGSYSPNGAITQYLWTLSGASGTISGVSGTVTYPSQGTYTVNLSGIDVMGQSGSASQTITVLPPTPTAVINITGSLKENRKFTIDSSCSTSHASYPINSSLTQWTITPVSGGTAGDIKYAGTLTGSVSKDILIKKAGTVPDHPDNREWRRTVRHGDKDHHH